MGLISLLRQSQKAGDQNRKESSGNLAGLAWRTLGLTRRGPAMRSAMKENDGTPRLAWQILIACVCVQFGRRNGKKIGAWLLSCPRAQEAKDDY